VHHRAFEPSTLRTMGTSSRLQLWCMACHWRHTVQIIPENLARAKWVGMRPTPFSPAWPKTCPVPCLGLAGSPSGGHDVTHLGVGPASLPGLQCRGTARQGLLGPFNLSHSPRHPTDEIGHAVHKNGRPYFSSSCQH
jgi:hypothetical protein